MNLRGAILHVIGLVAFAAALFAVPSIASAHGHHEHAAAQAAHVHHDHAKVSDVRDAAPVAVLQELTAAASTDGDHAGCVGSNCCGAGHCSACVSAVLPPPAVSLPHPASRALSRDVTPVLASAVLEGLRRPPRSFV